jgi:hypothetical protein
VKALDKHKDGMAKKQKKKQAQLLLQEKAFKDAESKEIQQKQEQIDKMQAEWVEEQKKEKEARELAQQL